MNRLITRLILSDNPGCGLALIVAGIMAACILFVASLTWKT